MQHRLRKIRHKAFNRVFTVLNYAKSTLKLAYKNTSPTTDITLAIFCDSRGYNYEKRSYFGDLTKTFIDPLIGSWRVKYRILPTKYTTLLDFLEWTEEFSDRHSTIFVLFAGIVDFAPRPKSSCQEMINEKARLAAKYDVTDVIGLELDGDFEGEPLFRFGGKDYIESILRKIRGLDLIYVPINRVDLNFQGTYWRGRPFNINTQLDLDDLVRSSLTSMSTYADKISEQPSVFTVDNVHLNTAGHSLLYDHLQEVLNEFKGKY